MEKEKVKEILKKRIENINPWETHALEYHKGLLDLINELESENKRLKKENQLFVNQQIKRLKERKNVNIKDIDVCKAQKDRIAELEKENIRLDKVVKHNQELIENGKLIASEELKQFAERLKEEIPAESTFEYLGYNGVMEVIDETLKELQK